MTFKSRFTGFSILLSCLSISPILATPGWNALNMGLNGIVNAIVVNGSDVYVGGAFTDAGGLPDADYLARWDGSAWHAVAPGLSAQVRCIAVSGTNVYVGGNFVDAGGNTSADRIARWDGSAWQALGAGLAGAVRSIVVSGSDVYAGGDFTNAGGIGAADYIARWNGSSWNALGSGLANSVYNLALKGTDLYAAGFFVNAGGNGTADYIARWDGSNWNALGTVSLNANVQALTVAGNNVYAGGAFTDAGGNANADRVARWDGTNWNALGTGISNMTSTVYCLGYDGAHLFVGGSFFDAGGNPDADHIARWTGSSWESLGGAFLGSFRGIGIAPNNVYAGGDFVNGASNGNIDNIGRFEYTSLPVELSAFRADPHPGGVLLHWQTESESENHYFQIEHSTDGSRFSPVGRQDGFGNSAITRYYSFLHDKPAPGLNYYRLRQVDFDETAHYSPIVSIRTAGAPALTLAPNPATDRFYILGLTDDAHRLRLHDGQGRLLWEGDIRDGEPLDVSSLPHGSYSLEVQNGTDKQVLRLVKK